MELPVVAGQNIRRGTAADQIALGAADRVDHRAFGIAGVLCRQTGRKTFQRAAKLVQRAHIAPVKATHPQAVIVAFQNAFGPQGSKRLAQRGAADGKGGDKIGFLQPGAGKKIAGGNGIMIRRRRRVGVASGDVASPAVSAGHSAQPVPLLCLTFRSLITYLYTDVYKQRQWLSGPLGRSGDRRRQCGLCAAITAAEAGCSVLVLEAAPRDMRGGNTRHTRNLRAMRHEEPTDVLTDAYSFEEYFEDLMRVTRGVTNRDLASLTLEKSAELTGWLGARGVRFQPALSGTLNLGRTNAFFLGGGRALNSLCRHAEGLGIVLRYDTEVADILLDDGFCDGVRLADDSVVLAKKVITTAGGFEANLDWLAEGWGEAAKNFLVRGTPWNTGTVLKSLLDQGVKPVGALDQCHAVAIDARAEI